MRRRMLPVLLMLVFPVLLSHVTAQTGASLQTFMSRLRNDLELLADRVYGGGQRPAGWTGNGDVTSQSIVADLWFDNEQLADAIFGKGQRPADWTGATSINPALVTRNVRHDLELAADTFIGKDLRPDGWGGAAPYHRCSRTVMNTLYLLQLIYNFTSRTTENVLDYCTALTFELEAEISRVVFAQESPESIPARVLAVRGDLERLADEKLGLNNRPGGWTFNKDVNSVALSQDNYDDMERLADTVLGMGVRPEGYVAAITDDPVTTFYNLRFNLELLADTMLGAGVRPRGWQGEDNLQRCDTLTQGLIRIAQEQYRLVLDPAILEAVNFCDLAAQAGNMIVENPPPPETIAEVEEEKYLGESQYAFAYLDVAATLYMGVMPGGTKFRAWYRNFNDSTMMFVSGDDFAVFIDRRWTTLSEEAFRTLPTLEGVRPLTFCDAVWCNGPAPTPTPTGSGPILEIILGTTPIPTLVPGATERDGKTLITWNQIRVTYVRQKPETGTAQVTLELCRDTAQIDCEPALSVFNTATGVALPVLSQINGLNVYELPYGYNPNLIIESATLFSTDVWLNDPTLTSPPTAVPTATPGP